MLTLFDNNTLLGLAIRNQVECGISRATDSIDAVPWLSAAHAHTLEHLLDQFDCQPLRLEWHWLDRGHAVEVTFASLLKGSQER